MIREACHVLILRQQLVREWLVDSSSRQVEIEGGGGGGGGGGKKKSKKKKKKSSQNNKNSGAGGDGVVEPTADELEKVMMGVARSQLKKWRDSERKQKLEGRATRWGLFSQAELQLLMFEAKELWKYQS